MTTLRFVTAFSVMLCSCLSGKAQNSAGLPVAGLAPTKPEVSNSALANVATRSCSSTDLLLSPQLTLRQRSCWYGSKLLAPGLPLRAALLSGMSELRHSDVRQPSIDDFGRRFGVYYARRTGQYTGELLAGYLNHEDPRYHQSLESNVWKRGRYALLSVLLVRSNDGHARPALAPLAGAFGSGLVGMPAYHLHNSWEDGMRRSGGVYASYFATALLHEFRPELSGFANRLVHRHN